MINSIINKKENNEKYVDARISDSSGTCGWV